MWQDFRKLLTGVGRRAARRALPLAGTALARRATRCESARTRGYHYTRRTRNTFTGYPKVRKIEHAVHVIVIKYNLNVGLVGEKYLGGRSRPALPGLPAMLPYCKRRRERDSRLWIARQSYRLYDTSTYPSIAKSPRI